MGDAVRTAGRVLLVEDEPTVLRITQRVLENQGYVVTAASDGMGALASIAAMDAEGTLPHVVLTDVRMPRLGGHELAAELARLYPAIPVVLMSGHTGREDLNGLPPNVMQPLVSKPFNVAMLRRALEQAMTRARGA